MRDCKSRKGSIYFFVGLGVYRVKYFSRNKYSDYEIVLVGIDDLAY
jgi:hypothetical protein